MKIFKIICLISYLIVLIIFTVGYASQPIFTTSYSKNNSENKYEVIITNPDNMVEGHIETLIQILFYFCIGTTLLLFIGILLGYIGLIGFIFISKIIFIIVFLLMLIVFVMIQISIIGAELDYDNTNTNTNNNIDNRILNIKYSNGNGYYMIIASLCLMLITNIIYWLLV
jgi:hypothetical protein